MEQDLDNGFFRCGFCGAEAPNGQHVCGDRYSVAAALRWRDTLRSRYFWRAFFDALELKFTE